MSEIFPLKFSKVNYQVNGKRLIKDVSFEILKNKRTAILGPNGSGKTTIMLLIHGLIKTKDGLISWNGRDHQAIKKQLAMIFDKPILLKRSVRENINFFVKRTKVQRKKRLFVCNQILKKFDLNLLANQPVQSLSAGEKQRLAIARALTLNPKVLLLDEPSSNLDPENTLELERIIKNISKQGMKIIFSTNDILQAKRIAQHILFLSNGKLIESLDAKTFFQKPRFKKIEKLLRGGL
jgi:tungstate transport system ATP-binding protein